ncbi:DUF3267 domain-containing protein [Staphylococcus ratti]|uniref:DUF3267 domain-containing protein n=1 Tax=Staphylococcus ratti TaxID=2892440 RepID=A0ABY3PEN7_9STAP|nr:DUF3267 domain-containing protein [Staphylococcus ratti]UEX90797.1 DUF3267 domain-containing protein [Staphylococcus ratti]
MYTLDLFANPKVLKRLLLSQFIVALVFIVLSYKWSMAITGLDEKNIIANLIVGAIGLCVLIAFHELLRYVLFRRLYKETRPKYKVISGMIMSYLPNVKMNRISFMIVMLLPMIVINMLLLILFINVPNTYVIFVFSFHMGYSCLAIYLVILALSNKQIQTVELAEFGLILYVNEAKPNTQVDTKESNV